MKKSRKPIIIAIILISSGAFILFNNLGMLPGTVPNYIFTWKTLLVALGLISLFRRRWFSGFTLIGVGAYFLIPEIYKISESEVQKLWPVLLIYIGIMLLLYYFFPPKKKFPGKFRKKFEKSTSQVNSDYMESTVVLGGDFKKISSYNFQGGKLISIMGGIEIDLSNCCLASGQQNVIELEVIMGGVSLTVPKEWNVIIEASSIMGGIFDETDSYIDPAAQIFIRGTVIMGGVEIKRAS